VRDFPSFRRTLNHFRSNGFRLAMDDVGSGYSGLQAIAGLAPDNQIDVSAGFRKKELVAGWDLGANGAYITGGRTQSFYAFLRGHRAFLDDRLDVDLDAGYINYSDCASADMTDVTCQGKTKGSTIRGGGGVAFRQSESWLFVGDLHLGYNSGTVNDVARGDIFEQFAMLRLQYSF